METTFYFVRHGESEANIKQIMDGQRVDAPLTEKGREQAKSLIPYFKEKEIDALFSSDLKRAYQTAGILGEHYNLSVETSSFLRERDFGETEGMQYAEFFANHRPRMDASVSLKKEERYSYDFGKGIEKDGSMVERLRYFLEKTTESYPHKHIVAVTHGWVFLILLREYGGEEYEAIDISQIPNTGHFMMKGSGSTFSIEKVDGILA